MTHPLLTPLAASLPASVPFVGPEAQERAAAAPFRARLGANESLFGMPPAALAAMQAAAGELWMYGDPENHDLKAALAQAHGVGAQNIVVGEGIDALLGLLVRLVIAPGDGVATSRGAYPTFGFHVSGFGGTLHLAPYRGDFEDPEALLQLAEAKSAKLLYISNPDNPMGSHHPAATIEAMIARIPDNRLLILDEAYAEFAPEGTHPRVEADDPRVIRFRTFSKAYGMAGARIGYAICAPGLARAFDRVRNHFGVSRIAQAGALAALGDAGWLEQVRRRAEAARRALGAIAEANGLSPLPSATNFMALDCGADGDFARRVLGGLIARGIFVRMPGVAPLDRCIRVSLGDGAAFARFAEALPEALRAARAPGGPP